MAASHVALLLAALLAGGYGLAPACFSPEAKIVRRKNLSCANKQYILDSHNKIRNHVASGRIDGQPKAANMIELRWNESLANLAQKRADTCLFEHGDLELSGERIGQNLAIVTSTADSLRLNITQMMELWYNEVFQFGYSGGFDPNSGHYSQLIWGSTREVGCGFTYYKEDGWFKMYFVCDYYPPGNYFNQKPYDFDKFDCKKYGLMDSRKYSKLCAVDNSETTACKNEKPATENNKEGTLINNSTSSNSLTSENNTTSEADISTELTMLGEDLVTEEEENMEDMSATSMVSSGEAGSDNLVPTTTNQTHAPLVVMDAGLPMSNETIDNTNETVSLNEMLLQDKMAAINQTMVDRENEVVPPGNGVVIILACNQSSPIKFDWKNKNEFFTAATKLLDLLVNRKIYLASQNL